MAKITWSGQSCFQISVSNSKDHSAQIIIDPFDESTGLKVPRFSADILLITHEHSDHNNTKGVKPAGESGTFLVSGPGEYEVKGIFIKGIPSFHDNNQGEERGTNTIYTIEAEEIKFCHLGDLGQRQLTDEQLDKIGEVDILMIPVGGTYTISGQEAAKIISQIEPRIVIPMHYQIPNLKIKLDNIEKFTKAIGKNSIPPQEKFQVKASNLPKEGMEIVILMP